MMVISFNQGAGADKQNIASGLPSKLVSNAIVANAGVAARLSQLAVLMVHFCHYGPHCRWASQVNTTQFLFCKVAQASAHTL
jgi:hypothetical protein